MRCPLAAVLLVVGTSVTSAGEIRWPDAEIPVPPLALTFIVAECLDYAGSTEESFDDCVEGEEFGYRATVMMLSDPETGEQAAERYRACRAGLGTHGGRFHRRRAECVGSWFGCNKWYFEYTRRASIHELDPDLRTAAQHVHSIRSQVSAVDGPRLARHVPAPPDPVHR